MLQVLVKLEQPLTYTWYTNLELPQHTETLGSHSTRPTMRSCSDIWNLS